MTDNNSNPNQLCRDQISGVLYRALESKYLSDIWTHSFMDVFEVFKDDLFQNVTYIGKMDVSYVPQSATRVSPARGPSRLRSIEVRTRTPFVVR